MKHTVRPDNTRDFFSYQCLKSAFRPDVDWALSVESPVQFS